MEAEERPNRQMDDEEECPWFAPGEMTSCRHPSFSGRKCPGMKNCPVSSETKLLLDDPAFFE